MKPASAKRALNCIVLGRETVDCAWEQKRAGSGGQLESARLRPEAYKDCADKSSCMRTTGSLGQADQNGGAKA